MGTELNKFTHKNLQIFTDNIHNTNTNKMLNCHYSSSRNSTQESNCEIHKCYKCGKTFNTMNTLMNHRSEMHPSGSICRNMDTCKFENCWFSHTSERENYLNTTNNTA